jgi:CBS domain-containing protein
VLVKDVMTPHPARIRVDADLQRAAEIVALSGASDVMVVDDGEAFVGVLSEGDVLRAAMPDSAEIAAAGATVADAFAVLLAKGRKLRDRPISSLVIRRPLVVAPQDHVGVAASIMVDRNIRRLPVVDDGRLLGTVSRADVCRALVGAL